SHGLGEANGVENRVERRQVGQEQEVAAQPVLRIDVELGLDAKHEVPVVPKIQVRRREDGGGEIHDQARNRGQQQHPHELGEGVHVDADKNVAAPLNPHRLEGSEELGGQRRALESNAAL